MHGQARARALQLRGCVCTIHAASRVSRLAFVFPARTSASIPPDARVSNHYTVYILDALLGGFGDAGLFLPLFLRPLPTPNTHARTHTHTHTRDHDQQPQQRPPSRVRIQILGNTDAGVVKPSCSWADPRQPLRTTRSSG